jgi:predicted ATPase
MFHRVCNCPIIPKLHLRCRWTERMARKNRPINLPAPYLKRVWLDPSRIEDRKAYPYCLPFLSDEFELSFDKPITTIVGENGVGKSTLLEGIAVLAGYDEAGGGKGYMPVDHSNAVEEMGGQLSKVLRASWLPKITNGWFFRAESFFSVARYLDETAREDGAIGPDFLSHSHGEGFMRFFEERCQRQGIFIFDEPRIRAVARAADRISETAAADGELQNLPGGDGHAFADADGLSECAAAADQIRAGAGHRGADGSFPADARVLPRPDGICGRRDRGRVNRPCHRRDNERRRRGPACRRRRWNDRRPDEPAP